MILSSWHISSWRKEPSVTTPATRRAFLGTTLATAAGAAGLGAPVPAAARLAGLQDEQPLVGEATSPSWLFVVHALQDPYEGDIVRPEEPEPGTRYVAAQVALRNESVEPLNAVAGGVRLVDEDGFEYLPGTVFGTEPRLPTLNMPPGFRVRGWVWYVVPEDAQLSELIYVPPPPRLAVDLSPDGAGDG